MEDVSSVDIDDWVSFACLQRNQAGKFVEAFFLLLSPFIARQLIGFRWFYDHKTCLENSSNPITVTKGLPSIVPRCFEDEIFICLWLACASGFHTKPRKCKISFL
jgi:hypothetical protein